MFSLPTEIFSGYFECVLNMFDLGGTAGHALQQDDVESAGSILHMVASQILSRQPDQLLLFPLMDGMDGSDAPSPRQRPALDRLQPLSPTPLPMNADCAPRSDTPCAVDIVLPPIPLLAQKASGGQEQSFNRP